MVKEQLRFDMIVYIQRDKLLLALLSIQFTLLFTNGLAELTSHTSTFVERLACQRHRNLQCASNKSLIRYTLEDENDFSQLLGARYIPECWHVLNPFLCAITEPHCSTADGNISKLPCNSLCLRVKYSCAFLPVLLGNGSWHDIFNCHSYPVTHCKDHSVEFNENDSSRCPKPLVRTDHVADWYLGIRGCALQCNDPLIDHEDHVIVRQLIAIFGGIALLSSFAVLATFAIDWKSQSRYPAVIIFYMNACFFVSALGWLLQFANTQKEGVACRPDGTLRKSEPSTDSGYGWCLVTFVLIYYSSIAGSLWFAILSFAWHISFLNLNKTQDSRRSATRMQVFHFLAWLTPVAMTMTILLLGEVDGDSLMGICFVGYRNHVMRQLFVLCPIGLSLLIGGYFLIRGMLTLCRLWRHKPIFLNSKATNKVKATIFRIGAFSVLAFIFTTVTLIGHVIGFSNQNTWDKSRRNLLKCFAISYALSDDGTQTNCVINHRPSIFLIKMQLLAVFGSATIVSSWLWTRGTLKTWRKSWRRLRNFDVRIALRRKFKLTRTKRRIHPAIHNALPTVMAPVLLVSKLPSTLNRSKRRRSLPLDSRQGSHPAVIDLGFKLSNRRKSDSLVQFNTDRRGTRWSLESYRTTSSVDRIYNLRDTRRCSYPNTNDVGPSAFGHLRSVTALVHRTSNETTTLRRHSLGNLRIIRLEDELKLPDIKTTDIVKSVSDDDTGPSIMDNPFKVNGKIVL